MFDDSRDSWDSETPETPKTMRLYGISGNGNSRSPLSQTMNCNFAQNLLTGWHWLQFLWPALPHWPHAAASSTSKKKTLPLGFKRSMFLKIRWAKAACTFPYTRIGIFWAFLAMLYDGTRWSGILTFCGFVLFLSQSLRVSGVSESRECYIQHPWIPCFSKI